VFKSNKADADGFLMAAVLFGVLSISCYIACYKLSTERISAPAGEEIKLNLTATLRGLLKNKPLLWILAASLIFMMCTMLIGAVNVYLFKDFFGSVAALSLVGIVQVAAAFIAIPLAKPMVIKFGKKETAAVGMSLAAAVYILLYFLPHLTATPFIVISAVGMFGYAFFNIVVWAFVTDVIDYHEYLTGLREDGTVYSIYAFSRKVGQAIAGGVGGAALAAVGYEAGRQAQTQEALDGIYALGTLVPGMIYGVIFIILVFLYPLTKQRTLELTDQLTEKRKVKDES
jgi:GPH family glycoside/pentoside/hexuronide:cation symporter